jgi:ABC-type nitrate/sulfonate/bicarbonate transport system permease component
MSDGSPEARAASAPSRQDGQKRMAKPTSYIWVSIWSVITFLAIWYLATRFWVVNSEALPSPQALVATFIELFRDGYTGQSVWLHILTSLEEALGGFVLGILLGVPLGLLAGYNPVARAIIMPYVDFFRPIPPIALVTLFVLFLGIGLASKIALIFLSGFWFMVLATSEGVRSLPRDLLRAGRSVGMSQLQIFRYVILPGSMPAVLVGMRTTLSISWALVVAAELVAGHSGLGYIVTDASNFFKLKVVYAAILIIAAAGFIMDRIIVALSRRVLHWQGR